MDHSEAPVASTEHETMSDNNRQHSGLGSNDEKSGSGASGAESRDDQAGPHQGSESDNELHERVNGPRYGLFSPSAGRGLKIFAKMYIPPYILIWVLILGVCSIYWGVYYNQQVYFHNYTVYLVDFDQQSVGPPIIAALKAIQAQAPDTTLGYETIPSANFGTLANVEEAIHSNDAWFAIVIQPNATSALNQALITGDATYMGKYAVSLIYESGRLEAAVSSAILPTVIGELTMILPKLNANLTSSFLTANIDNTQALTTAIRAATALANPIGYNQIDTHPSTDVPQATPAVSVGLIYLLIFAFQTVVVGAGARNASGLQQHLKLRSLILLKAGLPFISYILLSLFYSLLSLMFQIPFDKGPYGRGNFPMYWLLNYCAMLSLGLTMEFFEVILGPACAFILVPLIILNVAPTFKALDDSNPVYRYGYAMQFYNTATGSRTLIFGTYNDLAVNFGVLIAWIVVNLITISLALAFFRHLADRKRISAERAKSEERKQGQMDE